MKISCIDNGNEFDFGKTSHDYAYYRDIYPKSMYDKLILFGVGKSGQKILDLGSGTAVLPVNLSNTGAQFTATDISAQQIFFGRQIVDEKHIKNIDFKVCSAEETGFEDNSFDVVTAVQCFSYFDAQEAAREIYRVLKSGGIFCKIYMDWLAFEDEVINEMESFVLKYNPNWNGYGFKKFKYNYPDWADDKFNIEIIHSYNETLSFSKKEWLGRIKSCRGIGASLPEKMVEQFSKEYGKALDKYKEPLLLKHQIHIEIYRSTKTVN